MHTAAPTIEAYNNITQRMREVAVLHSTAGVLSWDQETYLPSEGVAFRAEQLGYLAGVSHRRATDPQVGDWLKACEDGGLLDDLARGPNVREWRLDFDRNTRVPASLVEEMAQAESLGREKWIEARRESKFSLFRDALAQLVELSRRKAEHLGYETTPYDALFDLYEPSARAADVAPVFAKLRDELTAMLPGIQEKTCRLSKDKLLGHYPAADQKAFNREIAKAMGFDFGAGRIDTTTHPFCSGIGPRDVRLTTRYDEADFTSSLFGVMHEAGHGLYEQGLPADAYGTPLAEAVSLGIHESQSRLWENQVGRDRTFWQHWYAQAGEYFPKLKNLPLEEFWLLCNRVEPSFIRVEADEVTYNLHIILRFEIEQPLIEGDLDVDDIPAVWNEKFERMFGLKVPDDANGCLQDIHWSMGGFGYFPTYTLGNLNAAQLFRAALAQEPEMNDELKVGRYDRLLRWLHTHVHSHGRRFSPAEMMERATGEPTQANYLVEYLRDKFADA